MLYKEFNDRIGRVADNEEYTLANGIYMDANELDKDEFCALWKKHKDNPLVQVCLKQMQRLWSEAHSANETIKELGERLEAMGDSLAQMNDTHETTLEENLQTLHTKDIDHAVLTMGWLNLNAADMRKVMQNYLDEVLTDRREYLWAKVRNNISLTPDECEELRVIMMTK